MVPIDQKNFNKYLPINRSFILKKYNKVFLKNLTNIIGEHNRKILENDKVRRKRKWKTKARHYFYSTKPTKVEGYGASLQHTNRILNKEFGYRSRYIPSHAPILIDKDIMTELQIIFAKEFQKTEAHRVRSGRDMQFAFSYYYFVMSKMREKSVEEIFDDFDTDRSR